MHKPLKDWMILKRLEESKIIHAVADSTEDDIFEVVSVGPGVDDNIPDVKAGDIVAIYGYLCKPKFKGETIILARARDVIVVLNGSVPAPENSN